jgi:hypothetical protein
MMRMAGLAVVLVVSLAAVPVAAAQSVEQLDPNCPPGTAPAFVAGTAFASLAARLGPAMGQPLSCVISDADSGDRVQWTDTGLALERPSDGLVTFTNGDRHWALTASGVVQWDGGRLLPEAIPPDAVAARLPADQGGPSHCGVDVVTDVQARVDPAGQGAATTSATGVAWGCFDQHFRACTPAVMATDVIVGSYRDRIVGDGTGGCRVVSGFLDAGDPSLVGPEMTCDLDNSRPFMEAVQDTSRCTGPLYERLWAAPPG